MSFVFEQTGVERLQMFLEKTDSEHTIERLTPDASTREFFRLKKDSESQIACVYPEKFDQTLPQIDVTELFIKADLPVAQIFEIDYELGLLTHEDFGDNVLRDVLINSDADKKERLLNSAIELIAKIQASTDLAYSTQSIASKLKFDTEKLLWELNFFKTHYFESLNKTKLDSSTEKHLVKEFTELSQELESVATVLTHRDYHAANLMICGNDLKIIDHQDARIGSVAYDLVSLLLDRIEELPTDEWLKEKKLLYLEQRKLAGLDSIEFEDFDYEFQLMTIQRCLKAIGTFSNQAANCGKDQYIKYIRPMFEAVLHSIQNLQKFPEMEKNINHQLNS